VAKSLVEVTILGIAITISAANTIRSRFAPSTRAEVLLAIVALLYHVRGDVESSGKEELSSRRCTIESPCFGSIVHSLFVYAPRFRSTVRIGFINLTG
jgi:hypothetical protein